MPPSDLSASPETPQAPVEIRQDAAITVQEALLLAAAESFPIGKSTLQRWAKAWADRGAASPVKSVLVTTRTGAAYRLDRDDLTAWLIEQKQNMRPGEVLQDPVMSPETPRDTARPHQTSQDAARPQQVSREAGGDSADQAARLREENMQLRIDVEVRKQLLNQAAGEINRQRDHIEALLREAGALQSQVLQLSAPASSRVVPVSIQRPSFDPTDAPFEESSRETAPNVDNQPPHTEAGL